MSLIEAINDLKKVTRNRVIIINVKSSKYQKNLINQVLKKLIFLLNYQSL